MVRAKHGHVVLPLLLLIGHELHEARILPDVVQVGISIKERITGKTAFGAHSQVFHAWLRFVHQSISRTVIVAALMEMFIAFPVLYDTPNSPSPPPLTTPPRSNHYLHP